jgi:hypothetical protein
MLIKYNFFKKVAKNYNNFDLFSHRVISGREANG